MNKKWIITLAILLVSAVLTACSGRQKEAEADSEAISFETTDLDGNVVKSEDLFKGHRLTMVNYPMITRELSLGRGLEDEAEVFFHLLCFFEFCHVDISSH